MSSTQIEYLCRLLKLLNFQLHRTCLASLIYKIHFKLMILKIILVLQSFSSYGLDCYDCKETINNREARLSWKRGTSQGSIQVQENLRKFKSNRVGIFLTKFEPWYKLSLCTTKFKNQNM